MDTRFAQKEYITSRTWRTLYGKFLDEFTQYDLAVCYHSKSNVPVFVRYNNRNVYGSVYYDSDGDYYFVDAFYRLTRDGFPIRLTASMI